MLFCFAKTVKATNPIHPSLTKLQLWGAANPLNTLKGEDCSFLSVKQVGICGDWMVAPSIEGTVVSGIALAETISRHATGKRVDLGLRQDFESFNGLSLGSFKTNPNL